MSTILLMLAPAWADPTTESSETADHLELKALQVRHFARMRAIIARPSPSERVVLCNLQLVPSASRSPHGPTASP